MLKLNEILSENMFNLLKQNKFPKEMIATKKAQNNIRLTLSSKNRMIQNVNDVYFCVVL